MKARYVTSYKPVTKLRRFGDGPARFTLTANSTHAAEHYWVTGSKLPPASTYSLTEGQVRGAHPDNRGTGSVWNQAWKTRAVQFEQGNVARVVDPIHREYALGEFRRITESDASETRS